MTSQKRKALIIAVVALLALGAFLWILRISQEEDRTGAQSEGVEAVQDAEAAEAQSGDDAPPAPEGESSEGTGHGRRPPLQLATATAEADAEATSGVIEGRVVSWSSGDPIAGAELTWAHGASVTSTQSNDEGLFRFEPDEPGPYELAVVTAEGYLPFAPEWGFSPIRIVSRAGFRIRDVTLSLRPAIDYQGRVFDPEGRPVANAAITILSTPGGQTDLVPLPDRFTSDAEGLFTFHAPDNALLEAEHQGFSPGRARLDTAAQVSHRLTIRLRPPGEVSDEATISGVVVDPDGDPVSEALVLARSEALIQDRDEDEPRHSAQILTDEQGRFSLSVVDQGSYLMTATHADFASVRREGVNPGTTELRFELSNGATLTGRISSQEANEPIAGFSVVVLLRTSELTRDPYRTTTIFDSDGRYEITGLGPGDYEVMATARDYAPSESNELNVPSPVPSEAMTLDFTLSTGGRLTGRVIDRETSGPLEHARVSVEAMAGSAGSAVPLLASTTTDAEGHFEIRGLNAGLRSVFVAAYNHHSRIVSGLAVSDSGDVGPITVDLRAVAEGESPTLELSGIGVVLEALEDALVIGRMIDGGGAAEAGLHPGDGIIAVDGQSVVDLGFQGSIERIRGPEGSIVRLRIRRAETGEIEEISVPRRRINT